MRDDRTPHSHITWLRDVAEPAPDRQFSCRPLSCRLGGKSLYIPSPGRRNQVAGHRLMSKAMLNEIYNSRILELAGNIPRLGRLPQPDASATAHSKLCGSTVTIDLKMDGDTVTDFSHEVKACALGQASSSIMARNVIGAKAAELRDLRETVRRMLKENGAPPTGKWADIAV